MAKRNGNGNSTSDSDHGSGQSFDASRRRFIAAGMAAAAGGLSLNPRGATAAGTTLSTLPDPTTCGIDHIVVVMMENRSFDHMLGWVPGADGKQAGLTFKDSKGKSYSTHNLAPHYQNCLLADPDHSYDGGRTEINDGAMDGFLLTQPAGDTFPIGYYTADSLPFFKGVAANWTICDRYFSGILAPTSPNRFYMHAGQTDRISNTSTVSTLPTVWDRMLGAGRSVAYYYEDVSYTALWGKKYKSFSQRFSKFASDVASGKLADLTYVDNVGKDVHELIGVSRDDHPYADVRDGQAFLNEVYNTIRTGPHWATTLMIINYDEWGGFYDHVTPPYAPVTAEEFAATGNDGRLGCRVPCVLIGPRARRGVVEHTQFDPNSILNMIAWRFGFTPLGARASSTNIAHALDFSHAPNGYAPAFTVPPGPFGGLAIDACLPIGDLAGADDPLGPIFRKLSVAEQRRVEHDQELDNLRTLGKRYGF
jgi:phospholipase C